MIAPLAPPQYGFRTSPQVLAVTRFALVRQGCRSSMGDRDRFRNAADLDRLARRVGGGRDRRDRTGMLEDVGRVGDVGGLPVRRDRDRRRVTADLDRLARGLSLFGIVVPVSALMVIPGQTYRTFGVELTVLAGVGLV